jgi:hypothetical protein
MDSGCRCNRWNDYNLSNISVAGWTLDSYAVTDNIEREIVRVRKNGAN